MGILLDLVPAHIIALTIVTISLLVILVFVFKYSKEVTEGFENKNANSLSSQNIDS